MTPAKHAPRAMRPALRKRMKLPPNRRATAMKSVTTVAIPNPASPAKHANPVSHASPVSPSQRAPRATLQPQPSIRQKLRCRPHPPPKTARPHPMQHKMPNPAKRVKIVKAAAVVADAGVEAVVTSGARIAIATQKTCSTKRQQPRQQLTRLLRPLRPLRPLCPLCPPPLLPLSVQNLHRPQRLSRKRCRRPQARNLCLQHL